MCHFSYQVAVAVVCSVCRNAFVSTHIVPVSTEPPVPMLPTGWRVLDGLPVCWRHTVDVRPKLVSAPVKLQVMA
jgi:hypothetical protein